MKNCAPQTKIFFPKHYHLKALKKRVPKNLITSNPKIEFFKDQCSFEEDGGVFPVVNFTEKNDSIAIYYLKKTI
jgi:hypothetical protein